MTTNLLLRDYLATFSEDQRHILVHYTVILQEQKGRSRGEAVEAVASLFEVSSSTIFRHLDTCKALFESMEAHGFDIPLPDLGALKVLFFLS